jgi:putative transcriptional regulator
MAIVVNLDLLLVKQKMKLTELAGRVDITLANMSVLKQNKARAIRFSTLDAICRELGCQPGDLLEYVPDPPPAQIPGSDPQSCGPDPEAGSSSGNAA